MEAHGFHKQLLKKRGNNLTSFLPEEGQHQVAAVVGEKAGLDGRAGVEERWGELRAAALGVVGAVDDAGNLGPVEGAGAHRAGLDRHV